MTKRETVASLRAQLREQTEYLAGVREARDRCITKAREVEETLGRVERNVEALRAEHERLREALAFERRERAIQEAVHKGINRLVAHTLSAEIAAHVHAVVTGSKDLESLDNVVSLKVETEAKEN